LLLHVLKSNIRLKPDRLFLWRVGYEELNQQVESFAF